MKNAESLDFRRKAAAGRPGVPRLPLVQQNYIDLAFLAQTTGRPAQVVGNDLLRAAILRMKTESILAPYQLALSLALAEELEGEKPEEPPPPPPSDGPGDKKDEEDDGSTAEERLKLYRELGYGGPAPGGHPPHAAAESHNAADDGASRPAEGSSEDPPA